MAAEASDAWIVWLVIALFVATCLGIIIFMAVNNNISTKKS